MDLLNVVEIAGVAFGFWSVWLTLKEKIACWPVGIVNILLFMVMFYWVKLYADLGLQVVFLVLSIYGWWVWTHPDPGKVVVPVTLMSQTLRAGTFAASTAATLLVGAMLGTFTDASVPYWDSMTTIMSVAAQYLMARKKLECWTIWISADVVDIGIYLYKGLYLTSGLYVAFLILATTGLITWWRSWERTKTG